MTENQPKDIYGYRARIGYTSPPAATEVFPYEFYRIVPKGVALVVTTLAIVEMDKREIDSSFDISLRAAKSLAHSKVDMVVLGGLPINRSRGSDVAGLMAQVEKDIGVPVSSSTSAQMEALDRVGAKKIVIAHPFGDDQHATFTSCLADYGREAAAVKGAGYVAAELGYLARSTPITLARALMKQVPDADTIWMPCPHWPTAEAIDDIEKEFGVTVVTAHQAITWQALRRCKVDDKIDGFGRLLREF